MPARSVWILRHAKAVADPPDGGDDLDRVLAPRGRRDATALGQLIGGDRRALGHAARPELALVSPAARTMATAQLVLEGWAGSPHVSVVDDLYGAAPEEVLDRLRALPDDIGSVMVVGHNPTSHALATGLIAKADKAGHDLATRRGFPTCALGIFTFDRPWSGIGGRTATLAALVIPPFDAP